MSPSGLSILRASATTTFPRNPPYITHKKRKKPYHKRMFLSTNRGCGISTVFSRTNFKGVCIGGRACVDDDATVKVDERYSPSHCADVSRKDKTSRSSDYATGRTSFWPADTQPTDVVESERGGRSDRFSDHWLSCGSIGEKRPLNPMCHGPRPRNPCSNRDWRPGRDFSSRISFSVPIFLFPFYLEVYRRWETLQASNGLGKFASDHRRSE